MSSSAPPHPSSSCSAVGRGRAISASASYFVGPEFDPLHETLFSVLHFTVPVTDSVGLTVLLRFWQG